MKRLYMICLMVFVMAHTLAAQIPVLPAANNLQATSPSVNSSTISDSVFTYIQIFPNAAKGQIILKVDDANKNVIQQGECIVYNNAGLPVAKNTFTTGTNIIYINTLSSGLYYIRLLQKNGQSVVRKFMIMN